MTGHQAGVPYFHGGKPGLRPGDVVLPPSETGVLTVGQVRAQHEARDPSCAVCRALQVLPKERPGEGIPSWVYVSSSPAMGVAYAEVWSANPFTEGLGWVYEVRPRGLAPPGFRVHPRSARVQRVCRSAVVERVVGKDVPAGAGAIMAAALGAVDPVLGSQLAATSARNQRYLRHLHEWQEGAAAAALEQR